MESLIQCINHQPKSRLVDKRYMMVLQLLVSEEFQIERNRKAPMPNRSM